MEQTLTATVLMAEKSGHRSFLKKFAWLSVAAAVATIFLKTVAYFLTGSIGLLSDAVESLVNLAGAIMALAMLTVAARPPDKDHAYGHSKAEYFSSVVEGTLILVAALAIAAASVKRIITPRPLEQLGIGLAVSVGASIINLVVALILRKAAKKHNSITLEANSTHLMTDVWTSVGVLAGVGAVAITGWLRLDPIVALAVAANIIWSGVSIIRKSVHGLMDTSLPPDEQKKILDILAAYVEKGTVYHAMKTRQSGSRRFVEFHLLVPGDWTVRDGHRMAEEIEREIKKALPEIAVITHLESLEDPGSWEDELY